MPNALQLTDPNADNPLAQAPSWADAAQSVAGTVSGGVDALGQWLAAQRAKQQRPPVWPMSNPVGTETTRQPQQLTMPTPGVQPVAFWGGQPVSQQFKDTAQSAIGNALGWVGSAGPGGPIRAFHGSPYDFERFDTSKIGTGEGAQAYGHGLYLAEKEGTAQSYRDALSGGTFKTPEGPIDNWDARKAIHNVTISEGGASPQEAHGITNFVLGEIEKHGSADAALKANEPFMQRTDNTATRAAFESAARMGLQPNPGRMYEVNIASDPEQFLHWDKPLSEQSKAVQDALAAKVQQMTQNADPVQRPMRSWLDQYEKGTLPGSSVYASLGRGTPESSAAAWQQAGIPGIRYLDQGSRGAGEGTHNYVVFDANTIDILRKYGLAGLGIGLSGAAAGTQGQPQQ